MYYKRIIITIKLEVNTNIEKDFYKDKFIIKTGRTKAKTDRPMTRKHIKITSVL